MTRDFGSRTMLLCIAMAVTAGCAWGQEVSQASPIESGWKLQFSDDFERDALGSNWSAGLARIEDGALAIGRESDMGNNVVTCQKAFPGAQRLEYDATTAAAEPCDLSAVLGGGGLFQGLLLRLRLADEHLRPADREEPAYRGIPCHDNARQVAPRHLPARGPSVHPCH